MKTFEQWWNKQDEWAEHGCGLHKDYAEYTWRAALELVLELKGDGFDEREIAGFILDELKENN